GCDVSASPVSACCFFHCSRHDRALHSCPTRRSSDLQLDELRCLGRAARGDRTVVADEAAGLTFDVQVAAHGLAVELVLEVEELGDRKSTRLNSSHVKISYAVFCLKKKTNTDQLDSAE